MADNSEITYWGKASVLKMSDPVSTGVMLVHHREPIVEKMERHVKTSEILIAVEGNSVICFAAPPSRLCDEIEDIQAFKIKQGDAIALHEGTWHWAGYPIQEESAKFIVVFAIGTESNDLQTKEIHESVFIEY